MESLYCTRCVKSFCCFGCGPLCAWVDLSESGSQGTYRLVQMAVRAEDQLALSSIGAILSTSRQGGRH